MCGRSSLTRTEKELEERFSATFYSEDLERYNPLPNYNVCPTDMHPVVRDKDPQFLRWMRWGLVPFWAKNIKIGARMINARVETVLEKPAFKYAAEKRRCLVPFDGFYEWKKTDAGKIPYRITLADDGIFCIAGLWETWKSPEGEWVRSFTLITTPPNDLVAQLHDRMPAILMPEQEELWIDKEISPKEAMKMIETPIPSELLNMYRVSTRVNKVTENDADLVKPVEA